MALSVLGGVAAIGLTIGTLAEGTDSTDASPEASVASTLAVPSDTPSASPAASESPSSPEVLTAETNEDFAALLSAVDDFELYRAFAEEYEGATIEFDSHVAAIARHGDTETRHDILIVAGRFEESPTAGPAFQFRDVSVVLDLNLTGATIPDSITVGQNLRVTARVDGYSSGDLILLKPVATELT